jgi:hypothetical protein
MNSNTIHIFFSFFLNLIESNRAYHTGLKYKSISALVTIYSLILRQLVYQAAGVSHHITTKIGNSGSLLNFQIKLSVTVGSLYNGSSDPTYLCPPKLHTCVDTIALPAPLSPRRFSLSTPVSQLWSPKDAGLPQKCSPTSHKKTPGGLRRWRPRIWPEYVTAKNKNSSDSY